MSRTTVLIVDDEESVHAILEPRLAGYTLLHARSGGTALELLDQYLVDVVVLDLNLPGNNGFALLERIRQQAYPAQILVLTGHTENRLAFEAGRRGARLFLEKSFEIYQRIAEYVGLAIETSFPSTPVVFDPDPDWTTRAVRLVMTSGSPKHRELIDLVRETPPHRLALLASEPGVNRVLWAHLVHELSGRADKPCVVYDAGCTPAEQIRRSVLQEGGVLSGESAGGTLFIDHAGFLPQRIQAELIQAASALEEVDVALVFGTNETRGSVELQGPLDAVVRSGATLLHLRLPPLRERRDEISAWIDLFTVKHAKLSQRKAPAFSEEALAILCACDWPGNDAQLEDMVARLVARHGGGSISLEEVPPECFVGSLSGEDDGEPLYRRARREFERYLVRMMVERHNGDRKAAARALGVSHSTIKGKLRDPSD